LDQIELLSSLSDDEKDQLLGRCRLHKYNANQIILDSGDEGRHDVFFVINGSVRIVNHSLAGREIAFANVREGGYFGELAALTDRPRTASVVALSECRLASLHPDLFQQLLMQHPEVSIKLITGLAEIVQRCDERIMDLSTLSAVQRVHADILRRAEPDPQSDSHWVVSPIPKHNDIASRVSTTRETVVRALKILSVSGIATRSGRRLEITNYERLTELVEDGAGQMIAAR
jgi:CRP-like cAMP-binding protein